MIINQNHPFLSLTPDMIELSKPLQQLGITYFTYTRSYDIGARIYLTTHRDALDSYFKEKWYLVGNVESNPSRYKPQVVFWSALPKQYIYDNCIRSRGIDHGIFMIEPHVNYCDFYGFATKKENNWVQNVYLNKIDQLKSFTLNFKNKASFIIKQAESSKIILPFHDDCVEFLGNGMNPDSNEITFGKKLINTNLTHRQLRCARLLIQGKTIKEIGNQMELSSRTIEDHVNNLKTKFYCRNKSELIVKMVEILK
jgi:DNA-binding CsgD family transcriptional regulator